VDDRVVLVGDGGDVELRQDTGEAGLGLLLGFVGLMGLRFALILV
jgi:hypothetical protein